VTYNFCSLLDGAYSTKRGLQQDIYSDFSECQLHNIDKMFEIAERKLPNQAYSPLRFFPSSRQ